MRETGRLIAELPRGKTGPKRVGELRDTDVAKFIDTAGIERRTAERWQSLSNYITDQAFDETIEAIKADDEDIIALAPGRGNKKTSDSDVRCFINSTGH